MSSNITITYFPFMKMLGLGFATVISTWALRNKLKIKEKREDEDIREINEVLFFTGDGITCRKHMTSRSICSTKNCAYLFMSKMMEYIESARKSLDICVYLITCEDLCNSILKTFRRGVCVRVVTDCDMSLSTGSKINELRKRGIEVRVRDSTYIMHHKYVVIDKKILMNGSLNWTLQAMCGNDDNLMITTQKQLVKQYTDNFETLWLKFKPKHIVS